MPPDDIVRHRQPSLMGAVAALDPRFLAHPADPFVSAGRRVSGLSGLPALEPTRIDLGATTKQRTKEFDFGRNCRCLVDSHENGHRYRLRRACANHRPRAYSPGPEPSSRPGSRPQGMTTLLSARPKLRTRAPRPPNGSAATGVSPLESFLAAATNLSGFHCVAFAVTVCWGLSTQRGHLLQVCRAFP